MNRIKQGTILLIRLAVVGALLNGAMLAYAGEWTGAVAALTIPALYVVQAVARGYMETTGSEAAA